MFHRRILPAEEELRDMFLLLAFSAVWYGALFHGLGSGATSGANAAVFLLSGALPLYVAYIKGRAALRCRKKRRADNAPRGGCRGLLRGIAVGGGPLRGEGGSGGEFCKAPLPASPAAPQPQIAAVCAPEVEQRNDAAHQLAESGSGGGPF